VRFVTFGTLVLLFLFIKPFNGFCESFTQTYTHKLFHGDIPQTFLKPQHGCYYLHKGWNKILVPNTGVDVLTTLQNHQEILRVALYDKELHQWALLQQNNTSLSQTNKPLLLVSAEPKQTLFIQARCDTTLSLATISISKSCQKYLHNPHFNALVASSKDTQRVFSTNKTISIAPRYASNFHRGYYKDSRVLLIYPKIDKYTHTLQSYGPAEPYINIKYDTSYEQKEFFIFDYMDKRCYRGIFPSFKTPPYPVLQELP